ncbi:hypothetical protein [Acinetobacter pittii]|uniref:hypothetical protein n=1 Tax=Acinetobacter pittii TaxID=48296 RepID=UPI0024DE9E87|nr:hypothetical protein [Acinetobacter pittii]
MANGFPGGNFRIVNKETGACIASAYGGQTSGLQDAVSSLGETGVVEYSHTNDRLFTVHDKVKNIEEELWYFDSNMLYNKVTDIRSSWVLGAYGVELKPVGYKLLDKDLENFISLLPEQDKETLDHLRTDDNVDIIGLLKDFIRFNGEVKIRTELVGKLDNQKFDDYLNIAIAYHSTSRIEQMFNVCASLPLESSTLSDNSNLSKLPVQLGEIIIASIHVNFLGQFYADPAPIKLTLGTGESRIQKILEKLKKEPFDELKDKIWAKLESREELVNAQESGDTEIFLKEAVKIMLELRKTLEFQTDEKNINTAKKILQTSLKSNESFEQLKTALNSPYSKASKIEKYVGKLELRGAGQDYQTKWAFEDGYIFVEGQPDAVLTDIGESFVSIGHRSDDPRQRWEFKSA